MYIITIDLISHGIAFKQYSIKSCFSATTHMTNVEEVATLQVLNSTGKKLLSPRKNIQSFEIEEMEAIIEKIKELK